MRRCLKKGECTGAQFEERGDTTEGGRSSPHSEVMGKSRM